MDELIELLEKQGKLQGRDYQIAGYRILGLKMYSGDWSEIVLPPEWTGTVIATIPDPEEDDQMDVVSLIIHHKFDTLRS